MSLRDLLHSMRVVYFPHPHDPIKRQIALSESELLELENKLDEIKSQIEYYQKRMKRLQGQERSGELIHLRVHYEIQVEQFDRVHSDIKKHTDRIARLNRKINPSPSPDETQVFNWDDFKPAE